MTPGAFDEHELLDLIEGRLGPERARELRAQLVGLKGAAGGVDAARVVEMMAGDRAALLGLAEPELPADFVADLEPMLARPMLYGTGGRGHGSYRRAQGRGARVGRRLRFAAVAAGLLILLGGSWVVTRELLEQRDSNERAELLASDGGGTGEEGRGGLMEPPGSGMMRGGGGGDAADWADGVPAEGAVVHHHIDLRSGLGGEALVSAEGEDAGERIAAGEGERVAVDVALVFEARDAGEAERMIASCIAAAEGESRGALVRNFSFEEAAQLEEQWRLARARRGGESQTAALIGERPGEFARRVEDQMRGGGVSGGAMELTSVSGVVAGDEALAPSFERQLVVSSRGAELTIVVRADEVEAWMRRLRDGSIVAEMGMWLAELEPGRAGEVVARPRDSEAIGGGPRTIAGRWGAGGRAGGAVLAELAAQRPGAIIELPVVVRER